MGVLDKLAMFKKRNKEPSKLRKWANSVFADEESACQKDKRWVEILSDSIIWSITRFGDRIDNEEFPVQYADDFAVFEWAAYAYYRIACWHQDHDIHEDQKSVFNFLVHSFSERFEAETGIDGVFDIILNRFDLYGQLEDDGKVDDLLLHVERLIIKSTSDQRLEPYEDNEPVIIDDIFQSFGLKISIRAAENAMIPAMMSSVVKFYELLE